MPLKNQLNKTNQLAMESADTVSDTTQIRMIVLTSLLGVSRATVYRLIKAGKLKPYKLTERTVTFNMGEVRAFIASNKEAA